MDSAYIKLLYDLEVCLVKITVPSSTTSVSSSATVRTTSSPRQGGRGTEHSLSRHHMIWGGSGAINNNMAKCA